MDLAAIKAICDAEADAFAAADDPERRRRIQAVFERTRIEREPGLAIVFGHALRDRRMFDWAGHVMELAARLPGARGAAFFERAVIHALVGEPAPAVRLLRVLEREQPLSAYQQMQFAVMLARTQAWAEADRRADAAAAMEPAFGAEADAFRAFFDYLRCFPEDSAVRRAEALAARHGVLTTEAVERALRAALREGRPYSLIRLNDGEGAEMRVSEADEARFAPLYARNRREFHGVWYRDDALRTDPDFLEAVARMDEAVAGADCLGAPMPGTLEGEYLWASVRNVPSLLNVVRKVEALARPEAKLCRADIHQSLLHEGRLDALIAGRDALGLVACHPALPETLKARFGIGEVVFHRTPGEASAVAGEREPFGAAFARLNDELRTIRPGVLHLVAAGIPGKVYCELIRRGGGVALDIGAVADIWMRAPTRTFMWDVGAHALGHAEPHAPAAGGRSPLEVMGPDRWAGTAELIDADPPTEEHRDVYYLPFRANEQWGVFDRDDRIVAASVDRYMSDDQPFRQTPTSYARAAEVTETLPDGDYLYGGRFTAHFGHFLLESLPRLWPLVRERRPGRKIVMHGEMNTSWWFAHGWAAELFGALGIGLDDIIHAEHHPFRIPRLTVPGPCLQQQKSAHRTFAEMCRAMGRKLMGGEAPERDPRPVWLSKTRLARGVRRVANEQEVETILQAWGVEVVHPQELSLPEQIRLLGSRPLAGTANSAMHATILSGRPAKVVAVHPYPLLNTNFILMDRLNGNDAVYLFPENATETPTPGTPFAVVAELSEPAAVAEAVLERLG